MMVNLLKGVLSSIALKFLDNYRHLSVALLKIEVAKSYLKGVQLARSAAIGLMRMGLSLVLVGFGLLVIHFALFILLPWTAEEKALLALVLGGIYMVSGVGVLRALMDERTWIMTSGAAEVLSDALDSLNKDLLDKDIRSASNQPPSSTKE